MKPLDDSLKNLPNLTYLEFWAQHRKPIYYLPPKLIEIEYHSGRNILLRVKNIPASLKIVNGKPYTKPTKSIARKLF